jgi:uncharacterized membrane protein YsdA (DUF1294 family)
MTHFITVSQFHAYLLHWLPFWLLAINLITFVVFGIDKHQARRGGRRVPERTLFTLAILGGSIGALAGMYVWHHKTLHRSFCIGIPVILLLQILIPAGLYLYGNLRP